MGGADCNSTDFGAAAYWDARYSSASPSIGGKGRGGFFDWYQAYSALRPILRACVPTSSRVLMLGCGNSRKSPSSYMECSRFKDANFKPSQYSGAATSISAIVMLHYVLDSRICIFSALCTRNLNVQCSPDAPVPWILS
jgi:hypothetical protein